MPNHSKLALYVLTALMAQRAGATSMTFSGSLQVSTPAVSSAAVGSSLKGVKSSAFDISSDNSGCQVLFKSDAAIPDGVIPCYFSVDSGIPSGMLFDGSSHSISGISSESGTKKVKYSIHYLSGSAKEDKTITTGELSLVINDPKPPVFKEMASSFDEDGFVTGYSGEAHKRQNKGSIRTTLEQRDFDQKVQIDGFGGCNIVAGQTSCDINSKDMLTLENNTVLGQKNLLVNANSANGFFPNVATGFSFSWDFRPPTSKDVVLSNVQDHLDSISTKSGYKSVIFSHVGVTINSPHEGKKGDWWSPTLSTLTLEPDPNIQHEEKLVYNSHTILDMTGKITQSAITKSISGDLLKTGSGEFLADFDLSNVGDGSYNAVIAAIDKYGNKSESASKPLELNRNSPTVALLNSGYGSIGADSPYFFFDKLIVGASNGFVGQIKDVKLSIGGINIPLTATTTAGVYISGEADTSTLTPGEKYPLTVVAEDIYGRKTTKSTQILYAPVALNLTPNKNKIVRYTEAVTVAAKTEGSISCTLKADRDAALQSALYGKYACYAEYELPNGLTSIIDAMGRTYIKGYINDETARIKYKLYVVSSQNNQLKVADTYFDIPTKEAIEPTIEFNASRSYNGNEFLSDVTGGSIGNAIVSTSPGQVEISVKVGDEEPEITSIIQKAGSNKETGSISVRIKAPAKNTWTVLPVVVTAKYLRTEKFNVSQTSHIYYVPTKRLAAQIIESDKELANTLTDQVKVQLGVYDDKTKELVFDRNAYSDWNVHLEQELKDKDENGKIKLTYKTISNTVKTSSTGDVTLTLDPKLTKGNSINYRAVADAITPLNGLDLTIKSRLKRVMILKGASVAGSINTDVISGKVPFTAKLSYKTASDEDKKVLGTIKWMISKNGGSFIEDETGRNRKNFNLKVTDPGKLLVKAIITNRATNIDAQTATTSVIGYELTSAKIQQTALVMEGKPIPVTIVSSEEDVALEPLDVQWSTDGKNWIKEGMSAEITLDQGDKYIYARIRPQDTDAQAGDKSWTIIRYTASIAKPRHLAASISGDGTIETNKDIELKGIHENLYPTISNLKYVEEWVMPDGSIQTGSTAIWNTPEEGAKQVVTYRVWLDGYKDATLTEKQKTLTTWAYHFPELNSAIRQDYQLAPATITVLNKTSFPKFPGVVYSTKFEVTPSVETKSQSETKYVAEAKNPGVYTVKMIVSDNRGNSESKEHMISLDEASPVSVKLTPYPKNKFMREPLDMVVDSAVVLEHDRDAIQSFTWKLDGITQDTALRKNTFTGLKSGHHQISFEITSLFGQRGTGKLDVDVVENQKPTCNPTVYNTTSSWRVTLNCKDPDGKVIAYRWILGDEAKGNTSDTITATKALYTPPLNAHAVATDDSGGETEVDVQLQ